MIQISTHTIPQSRTSLRISLDGNSALPITVATPAGTSRYRTFKPDPPTRSRPLGRSAATGAPWRRGVERLLDLGLVVGRRRHAGDADEHLPPRGRDERRGRVDRRLRRVHDAVDVHLVGRLEDDGV